MEYEFFMEKALELAKKAYNLNEVPIGCVIVQNNEIISQSCNLRNTMKNALGHAEIEAINNACQKVGDWRLEDCTLFVTIEPCPMCAGAILQARIPEIVYGAANKKAGCCGSVLNILDDSRFNHRAKIVSGILEEKCSALMTDFFRNRLKKIRTERETYE